MPLATNDALIATATLDPAIVGRFWAGVAVLESPNPPNPYERLGDMLPDSKKGKCWLWRKGCNGSGYGVFYIEGEAQRGLMAHRFAYVSAHGPITAPEVRILQTCQHRACCNPAHLEARLAYGEDKPAKAKRGENRPRIKLAKAAIRKEKRT